MKLHYAVEPSHPSKAAKAMGTDLKTSFKNTWNVCAAIKGMPLREAQEYLEEVLEHKRCIPYRRFSGGVGRTGQAKEWKTSQGRWPQKSVKVVMSLLQNAESNAEFKNLSPDKMIVKYIAANRARQGRRRTYRAHGRIGAYLSQPCHVQIILQEKEEQVEKPEANTKVVAFNKKGLAMLRMKENRIKTKKTKK
mmetsp:Transcript_39835/g.95608  ORF Transcript_39835/g.95608 Transcript_39835/m.95608 type:complete len:193 (+) Transcript_39835:83-661(+)